MSIHAVLRDAFAEYELIPWTSFTDARVHVLHVLEFDDLAAAEAWLRRTEPAAGGVFLRQLVEEFDGASVASLGLSTLEAQLARAIVSGQLVVVRHELDVMSSEMPELSAPPEYVAPEPVVFDNEVPQVEARLRHEPKISVRAGVSVSPMRAESRVKVQPSRVESRVKVQPSRVESRVAPQPRRIESTVRPQLRRIDAKLSPVPKPSAKE